MSKRPTPKKRRSKTRTRTQRSAYIVGEVRRLKNRANSPYSPVAKQKHQGEKAVEKITRIKA